MRASTLLAVVAGVAMAVPSAAHAQWPVKFQVTPFAGGSLFLGDLPSTLLPVGASEPILGAELEDGFVAGAHAGVRIGRLVALEGTVAYAPVSMTAVSGLPTSSDATILTFGGSALLYAPSLLGRVDPFIAGGVGVTTLDYEPTALESETDFAWSFGGGLDVMVVPSIALRLEARDWVSLFDRAIDPAESEYRHDLLLTAGLQFTLPFGAATRLAAR